MGNIVDVVIPSYNPDARLLSILERLSQQTLPVRRVHLINTEQAGLDALLTSSDYGSEKALLAAFPFLSIRHIHKTEFDHGGTRNLGVEDAEGADYVVMMTQDALPAGNELIERLILPFADASLIAVYARQLPYPDADPAEVYTRSFNYPDRPQVKSQEDFARLGIKTYFCSNVCAAYRRNLLLELGMFPLHMIFNEDMVFAGRALQAGYRIRYTPEAKVYHSHNYGASAQFHRNFDLGVSQAQHPEIFAGTSSEGEGMRYVKEVVRYLRTTGNGRLIPQFCVRCAARLTGYRLGKGYQKLPAGLIRKCTSNPAYWES